jgi:DNA-binding NarL/FixJ family response regulator
VGGISVILNRPRPEGAGVRAVDGRVKVPPKTALSTLRVVIVDDDELFAESLAALLAAEDDIDVIGWVSDGVDAVAFVAVEHPDVVVMDIAMPRMNGVEAARIIGRDAPDTEIILLSGSLFGEALETIAGETGASAYVTKASVAVDLIPTLKGVAARSN